MAEPEPLPFIAFRQGRGRLRVQPRNAQGWQWLIVWMVPLLAMTVSYGFYGASDFAADNRIIWNSGFLIACLIWGVSMSRWTLARAGGIEVPEGYRHRLVLCREDQHVAWRGDALPADVPSLVRTLCGG